MHSSAAMRTPKAELPNTVVPARISHATMGGWSR